MSSRLSRSIIYGALTPVLSSLLLVAGCDTPQHDADKKIDQQVSAARSDLQRGDEASDTAGHKALEAAAGAAANPAVNPLTRVYAKSTLAQSEMNVAGDAIQRVDRDELKLAQLVYEISQLAAQVDQSHALAASYGKYDPAAAKAAIAQKIAEAQGGADKLEWCKADGATLPTLAAVKQNITKLQTDIDGKKNQTKSLEDQRAHTLDEAEQALKNADASKGQQSVDAFKQASELRKQAGLLSIQIDRSKAETVPLVNDLAVAQGQQVVLEEAIKQLQDQAQSLEANWQGLQASVASQSTLAQQIVGNGAPPSGSTPPANSAVSARAGAPITAKAAAMAQLVADIQSERGEAESNLNNAITHFGDAGTAAQQVTSDLATKIGAVTNQERPEVVAWKNLQAIVHPMVYTLQVGTADRMLADLRLSQVESINGRQQMMAQVNKSLTAAGITVPAELTATNLDSDKKTAIELANTAYSDADGKIGNVKDGAAPPALKDTAAVQHILLLYGESQLARASGDDKGVTGKLQDAKTERDAILQNGNVILPPMPSELVPSGMPAPTTPAGAPGTPTTPAAPTAAPSKGA